MHDQSGGKRAPQRVVREVHGAIQKLYRVGAAEPRFREDRTERLLRVQGLIARAGCQTGYECPWQSTRRGVADARDLRSTVSQRGPPILGAGVISRSGRHLSLIHISEPT